jgi:thiol-disulfide isomerase/thioredoxin
MSKKISLLIVIALIALGGLYLYNKYKVVPSIDFSALKLKTLQGDDFDFNSLKGKKTIVSFGASWCPNCINEMNAMQKIMNDHLQDVQIVIIDDEPAERIADWQARKNYPFLFLELQNPFNDIGIFSIPVTYFFNASLELKKEELGEIDWADPSTREHFKQVMN